MHRSSTNIHRIFQYSFYPLVLIGTLLTSFYLTEYFSRDNYIFIPGNVTLLFLVFFVIFERLVPYRKDWTESKGDVWTDVLQTFLVLPSASKLAELLIPIVLYYPLIWMADSVDVFNFSSNWGLVPNFILGLLVCEFFYYWYHRFGHESPFLWRFHSVHHGAQRVYWLNSGRFHVFDAFSSSFFYLLPLVFLGVSSEVVILILTFSAITGFLEHVNIDFKAGWLNYLFNTAELHRWHHSDIILESNTNYGKVLVIWDHVFRSFYFPKNKAVKVVGVQGRQVPNSFFGQLMHPFKPISSESGLDK